MALTISDVRLLFILNKKQCVNAFNGLSRMELMKEIEKMQNKEVSSSKIHFSIQRLKAENFIAEGIRKRKAYTYFITESGIDFLLRNTEKEDV